MMEGETGRGTCWLIGGRGGEEGRLYEQRIQKKPGEGLKIWTVFVNLRTRTAVNSLLRRRQFLIKA
jgi:hypothetical protein